MMLVHLGQAEIAERVHNAWLKTIEDGLHTYDIFTEQHSREKVGTREFGDAVIARLGQRPEKLKAVNYARSPGAAKLQVKITPTVPKLKEVVGVDVFLHWRGHPDQLAAQMQPLGDEGLKLKMITNRGVKVWPDGFAETFCTDHWRCRFVAPSGATVHHSQIVALLFQVAHAGLDFIKTESLCKFDGQPAYSLGQGE